MAAVTYTPPVSILPARFAASVTKDLKATDSSALVSSHLHGLHCPAPTVLVLVVAVVVVVVVVVDVVVVTTTTVH